MKSNWEDEYRFLWDGTDPGWVLIRDPVSTDRHSIYNTLKQIAMLIEDDSIHAAVCARMMASGCEVLNDLPRPIQPVKVQRES